MTLEEARAKLLEHAPPPRAAHVLSRTAAGYVLAERLVADRPIPPFDRAAMDGYAVRSADLGPEGGELTCAGEIRAGDDWTEALQPGICIAIMTGAAVPTGADAVIEVEATGGAKGEAPRASRGQLVSFGTGAKPGRNIAPRGEDAQQGDVLLEAGVELNAAACGLLATCGVSQPLVYTHPTVALLSTGNEVVDPEATPAPYQIRDANRAIIAAMLARHGFTAISDLGIAPDEPNALREGVIAGLAHDVLIISGGVSMGVSDIVPEILAEQGVERLFAGVAVKPGKPLWAGVSATGRVVLAMPGNPLAALVHTSEMAVPLLRKMAGHAEPVLPLIAARLTEAAEVKGGRLVVQAAVIRLSPQPPVCLTPRPPLRRPAVVGGEGGNTDAGGGGGFEATPLASHGSADLVGAARANGLIFLPPTGSVGTQGIRLRRGCGGEITMTHTALAEVREENETVSLAPFDYLRVSVTQRCQLRCAYCRPAGERDSSAKEGAGAECGNEVLEPAKLLECCAAICAAAPIRKIRLSGGEPLLQPCLPDLIAALTALPQKPEVVATTNGVLLAERAAELRAAGLRRLNVSLDTADREAYRRLTGEDALGRVLQGLAAARAAGFEGTKINAVLTRTHTDDDILRLAELAADHEAQLRFIELMPIGPGRGSYGDDFVPVADRLQAAGFVMREGPCGTGDAGRAEQPERFAAALPSGREVSVGVIASMTRPFCASCRRIRLSADGNLIPCLLSPVRVPLVGEDGSVPEPDEVRRLLLQCSSLKRRAAEPGDGPMWAIGG